MIRQKLKARGNQVLIAEGGTIVATVNEIGWGEQAAEIAEQIADAMNARLPGPISDSASGGASDSGGVDLSGIQFGQQAETRGEGVATLVDSWPGRGSGQWCYLWRLMNGWEFSTGKDGKASGSVMDESSNDIIRLLPGNGGGT